jgi:hypothetical protein
MANIVIDLSTIHHVTIRPVAYDEEFADAPHPAEPGIDHYWVRTPYGNLLYATGPEQLGALLAMLGAIELELNRVLTTLMRNILTYKIENFTIKVTFDSEFISGRVLTPNGEASQNYTSISLFLDKISEATQLEQESSFGRS